MKFVILFLFLSFSANAAPSIAVKKWIIDNGLPEEYALGKNYYHFSDINGDGEIDSVFKGSNWTNPSFPSLQNVKDLDTPATMTWWSSYLASRPENVHKANLVGDLKTAIQDLYGLTPPYSKAQIVQQKAQMRADMAQNRSDVESANTLPAMIAAQKELNKRQGILNIIREIKDVDPRWNIEDVK